MSRRGLRKGFAEVTLEHEPRGAEGRRDPRERITYMIGGARLGRRAADELGEVEEGRGHLSVGSKGKTDKTSHF